MSILPQFVTRRLLVAGLGVLLSAWGLSSVAQIVTAPTSVRQLRVVGSKDTVEIEVEASDRIVPQTQVLTGPDRLVVDFPNAVPGSQLRSQSVNRGQVKDIRIGLFQPKPPITRVVLDLKTAQSYQVFPSGRTIMIKVINTPVVDAEAGVDNFAHRAGTGLVNATHRTAAGRVNESAAPQPLEVSFRDGMLAIKSNKSTLSEVLFAVQQRTGADIAIPAGAEQERVVADLGPGPAQEVLAHLLNGSKFNFLIMNAASDPRQLDRVILSPRTEGVVMAVTPPQNSDDSDAVKSIIPARQAAVPPSPALPEPVGVPLPPQPEIPPQAQDPPQQ